jgi:isocitrate dehydrogenase (NAD+)
VLTTLTRQEIGMDVTLFPGDGVGPEVVDATRAVIAAAGVSIAWDVHEVGPPALALGEAPLPEAALVSARTTGVALKGPVSTPIGTSGFRSVNVGLRRELALYAQARPCRARAGVPTRFPDVDLVVIRETTEDLYAGIEFPAGSDGAAEVVNAAARHGRGALPAAAGLSIKFVTEAASRRIVAFAIDYARRHGRRKITAVHKATVMRATDGIFLEVARELAAGAPDLEFEELQVDNACGQLVRRPEAFDVMVMGIHYGDVISDLAAGLVGGVGVIPGVNVGEVGVMFEPAHGTVPRHAGRDRADPTAEILCGAMLLEHLGEHDAATRIERAVDRVIAVGDCVTYDLRADGDARPVVGTRAMADAVIDALGE